MTVDQLRSRYGARSDYHLSQILGVTRQAVSEWRSNGRVPKQREKDAPNNALKNEVDCSPVSE